MTDDLSGLEGYVDAVELQTDNLGLVTPEVAVLALAEPLRRAGRVDVERLRRDSAGLRFGGVPNYGDVSTVDGDREQTQRIEELERDLDYYKTQADNTVPAVVDCGKRLNKANKRIEELEAFIRRRMLDYSKDSHMAREAAALLNTEAVPSMCRCGHGLELHSERVNSDESLVCLNFESGCNCPDYTEASHE